MTIRNIRIGYPKGYPTRMKKGSDRPGEEWEAIAIIPAGTIYRGRSNPRTIYITPAHRRRLGRYPHKAVGRTITHEQLHDLLNQLREDRASDKLDTMDWRTVERLGL